MKNFDWDRTWVGIVLGILTPLIIYAIYYFLVHNTGIKRVNVSICVTANLIPFYMYQRKEMNNGLKGVLITTIAWALIIICLSYFTNYLRIG